MFKKLTNYLLTHYPLVWNTKAVWVIGISLIIHLLFFISGFLTINAESLQHYYSLSDVPGAQLITFSVLCSLSILILWLVFYLRNNAYRSFYIIDKFYLAKEFLLILLAFLSSISFFESYKGGAWLKTRTLTSREQLVQEANIANLARTFIPRLKKDYFKVNGCRFPGQQSLDYNENTNYFDSTSLAFSSENYVQVRSVLKQKDAFSYKNYCNEYIHLDGYSNFLSSSDWKSKRDYWIDNHQTDSITAILEQCVAICRKYGIEQRIEPAYLAKLVFTDSFYSVTRTFPRPEYDYLNGSSKPDYFEDYTLHKVFGFIDECYLDSMRKRSNWIAFTVEFYIALWLSILLFCYRLYSKKVFLISMVGTIIWAIIFILFASISAGSMSSTWFYLLLCILFLLMAVVLLRTRGSRTVAGILLNWHIYMLPFFFPFIFELVNQRYSRRMVYLFLESSMQKEYPISYWISHNLDLLSRLNLLFVILYVAFIFTRLSKKWHIQPEE